MIRTHWGWKRWSLETAVTVLRQRGSGRRITLVSMIHIGRGDYYAQIDAIVAAHEQAGGVVLYEGLGSLSESEIAGLSAQERAIYRTLAPLHDLYRTLAGSLGLVFQGEALHYNRERWINADLTLRELVRRWADAGAPLLPLEAGGAVQFSMPDGWLGRATGETLLLQTPLLLKLFGGLSGRIPSVGRLRELLLSDRNRAALDALETTDPGRDALVLYGAGHMADLLDGLERRGFALVEQTWLTAYLRRTPWQTLLGRKTGQGPGGGRGAQSPRAGSPRSR